MFVIAEEEGGTTDTQFNDLIQGAFRIQLAVSGELTLLDKRRIPTNQMAVCIYLRYLTEKNVDPMFMSLEVQCHTNYLHCAFCEINLFTFF